MRGGNLHPLNYARGLADAVQHAGSRIHARSRVLSMMAEGMGHVCASAKASFAPVRC